jgi:hypothetical protein
VETYGNNQTPSCKVWGDRVTRTVTSHGAGKKRAKKDGSCIGCAPTSSSLLPPSMPISTRKTNADVHPGRIVLENQQSRRTKRQVEEDNMRAKAAAIVEREEKEANHLSVLTTIAEIEDTIEKTEAQLRMNTTRPDLHPNRKQPKNTMSKGAAHHKE